MNTMNGINFQTIRQYLLNHNFKNTVQTLMIEAENMSYQNDKEKTAYVKETLDPYQQIISFYKAGDWRNFFKFWNSLLPEDVKNTKEYKILSLNLHVHFAVLPRHKSQFVMQNELNYNDQQNFTIELEKNMGDSMEQLQRYLNTTGKELENDAQLRPFFALPFIEDPSVEPVLSKVFQKDWLDELTEKLHQFLDKHKQNMDNVSQNEQSKQHSNVNALQKSLKSNVPITPNDRNYVPIFLEDGETAKQYILHNDTKSNCQKSKTTQTHSTNNRVSAISCKEDTYNQNLPTNETNLDQYGKEFRVSKSNLSTITIQSNYEKLKLRFHKLHADYHKLISIAGELTVALENSVKGQTVDLQSMLETCIQIFPDLFNQNIRDSSHFSSALQFDNSQSDGTISFVRSTTDIVPPVSPKQLDFKKIKLHLITGDVKTKLFLLQALRWKITLGQPGERDEAIHEYITKDLFGLHGKIASDKGKSILPYLLFADGNIFTPHPLQQSAARLLNVLASFRCGRDYLSFGSTVVNVVFKCLNNIRDDQIDKFTCNMMIAMLHKLSLRKQQRIYMIENGLVEWLIHHLHGHYRIIDSFRLEYSTALLMNLSLHRLAQKRASVIANLLISTLVALLSIDHISSLPYVNGTLNNFLSNQVINDEAKKMKLSHVLEHYRKHKTGEIRNHFDHILRIHRGESTVDMEDAETADDDNEEFDVLETEEVEENDPVKNDAGELSGESLLSTYYTISRKSAQARDVITNAPFFKQSVTHPMFTCDVINRQPDIISSKQYESVACSKNFLARSLKQRYGCRSKNNFVKQQSSSKLSSRDSKSLSGVPNLIYSSFNQDQDSNSPPFEARNRNKKISSITKFSSIIEFQGTDTRNKKNTDNFCLQTIQQTIDNKISNQTDAVYLYENKTASNESSKTTMGSSITLVRGSQGEQIEADTISSIASLNVDNSYSFDKSSWNKEMELDTEEAFLAKPKLPRTPP